MDKHTEQPAFESKFAINQPELRKPVIETLWGGVIEEYGRNLPLESEQAMAASSDVDLLAEIESSREKPIAEEVTVEE